jgi:protein-tyrosine phosphatase
MSAAPTITPYWIDTTGVAGADGSDRSPLLRMAIVPCPPGGSQLEGGVRSLKEQGIDTLVSLLTAEEARVLRLEGEGRVCRQVGIDYRWLPVTDHSIPGSMEEFRMVVDQLQHDLRAGKGVGAHCYAGIGRSCVLMACLLCMEGLSAEEAFDRLSLARGLRVPDTWLQSQWVQHFAAALPESGEPF